MRHVKIEHEQREGLLSQKRERRTAVGRFDDVTGRSQRDGIHPPNVVVVVCDQDTRQCQANITVPRAVHRRSNEQRFVGPDISHHHRAARLQRARDLLRDPHVIGAPPAREARAERAGPGQTERVRDVARGPELRRDRGARRERRGRADPLGLTPAGPPRQSEQPQRTSPYPHSARIRRDIARAGRHHRGTGRIGGRVRRAAGRLVQPPEPVHVTSARHSTMGPSSSSQTSPGGPHVPPSGGATEGQPVQASVPSSPTHCPSASQTCAWHGAAAGQVVHASPQTFPRRDPSSCCSRSWWVRRRRCPARRCRRRRWSRKRRARAPRARPSGPARFG